MIQLSEAILRFFKVLPPVDDPSPVWIKVLLFAVNYRILLSFVFALGLAVLIIGMVIVVHYLMANLVRRRRARVFISFQHEREPVADALVDELTRRGVLCVKLPFVKNPDPDTLLEQIRQAVAVPWFILAVLLLFLLPYGLFSMTRFVLRAKLRRVISGKRFSESFLPETLAYSLTRADLFKTLYRGELLSYHESHLIGEAR